MTGWRPTSGPGVAARRAERLAAVRNFFSSRDVLEVEVPALSDAAVSDPNIDSLEVRAGLAHDATLYLATSPEYAMKRLLAAGYPDIFAIARVFRDGELGRRHEPEFTLIEWYRHDFGLEAIAAETCELIGAVLDRPDLGRGYDDIDYVDAFTNAVGIDPLSAPADALASAAGADARLREAVGDDRDAWLDLLVSSRVAESFAGDRLTVVSRYPASQAALARLDPGNPAVALRFEVFYGAMELANGYVELADASEQRERFENERAQRCATGGQVAPIDERFLAALEYGLPDCAGVAIGFERLHMIYEDTDDIADVIAFSFRNRE